MKKLKKRMSIILILVILWLAFHSSFVQAHDIEELDPNGWITLPTLITSATTRVTISSNAGNYQFYYQIQFLTDTQFANIQNKITKAKEELADAKATLDERESEVEAAYATYEEELEKDPSSEATNQAREAYLQIYETYKTVLDEYNAKVKAENAEVQASIPSFVESNWKQANDGTVEIDYGDRSGQTHFTLWAKLVTNEGTDYDCNVYSTTVAGQPYVSMSETSLQLTVGGTYTLTATPRNTTQSVVWSSSNEEVVTVDQNGNVRAVKEGTATISAKLADDSAEGTCAITVRNAGSDNNNQDNQNNQTTNNTQTPQGNITIPSNQTQNVDQGNLVVNGSNRPTNISGNLDNTKAPGTIPQTGTDYVVLFIIAVFALVGWFAYRKYRKYNF